MTDENKFVKTLFYTLIELAWILGGSAALNYFQDCSYQDTVLFFLVGVVASREAQRRVED